MRCPGVDGAAKPEDFRFPQVRSNFCASPVSKLPTKPQGFASRRCGTNFCCAAVLRRTLVGNGLAHSACTVLVGTQIHVVGASNARPPQRFPPQSPVGLTQNMYRYDFNTPLKRECRLICTLFFIQIRAQSAHIRLSAIGYFGSAVCGGPLFSAVSRLRRLTRNL